MPVNQPLIGANPPGAAATEVDRASEAITYSLALLRRRVLAGVFLRTYWMLQIALDAVVMGVAVFNPFRYSLADHALLFAAMLVLPALIGLLRCTAVKTPHSTLARLIDQRADLHERVSTAVEFGAFAGNGMVTLLEGDALQAVRQVDMGRYLPLKRDSVTAAIVLAVTIALCIWRVPEEISAVLIRQSNTAGGHGIRLGWQKVVPLPGSKLPPPSSSSRAASPPAPAGNEATKAGAQPSTQDSSAESSNPQQGSGQQGSSGSTGESNQSSGSNPSNTGGGQPPSPAPTAAQSGQQSTQEPSRQAGQAGQSAQTTSGSPGTQSAGENAQSGQSGAPGESKSGNRPGFGEGAQQPGASGTQAGSNRRPGASGQSGAGGQTSGGGRTPGGHSGVGGARPDVDNPGGAPGQSSGDMGGGGRAPQIQPRTLPNIANRSTYSFRLPHASAGGRRNSSTYSGNTAAKPGQSAGESQVPYGNATVSASGPVYVRQVEQDPRIPAGYRQLVKEYFGAGGQAAPH